MQPVLTGKLTVLSCSFRQLSMNECADDAAQCYQ